MLRREQIERLKERYPAGTVVRLGQMEGEHQMPSGMEGKVIGVDDIGQIHVEWENGSTLALNVEEDDFTVVPQKETLSEKKCREFLGKINEILKETDFYLLNVSCNGGDTAYAAQKLLAMHQAFETVYGEGYVDEEYGMVMMPAVVCGRDSGIRTLALVTLDLESSGEHFGTIFMTPGGLLEQGSSSLSEKQKQALAEYYIPYDYWYTPLVERDHHVDFTQMPEEVADIRRMVDELLVQACAAQQRADLAALEQLEPANVPMPFVPQVRRTPRQLLKIVIIAAVCAALVTTVYAFWPEVAVILEGSRAYLAVQEAPQTDIPMEQMQLTYVPEGCTVAWDDSTYQKYGVYYCLIDNGKQGREQQLLGIAQMPLENKVNIQGRGPDDAITEEDKANIEQQIMIVDDIAALTAEQIEDCSVVAWTAGDSYYVASVYRWQDKAEVVEILQGIR